MDRATSAIMGGTDMSRLQEPTTTKTEFQALLHLAPEPNDDRDLAAVAELTLDALRVEADGLALGPVVCIDLDRRIVEIEMTIEATSASEVHQKMGLILGALERGAPFLLVQDSSASRSQAQETAPELAYA
jgi:hypothetical protein